LNALPRAQGPYDGDIYTRIIQSLRDQGYCVVSDFLPTDLIQSLFIDIKKLDNSHFKTAAIGRHDNVLVNRFVRGDRICWVDEDNTSVKSYLDWIESLRLRINRELYLGLFDFECMYAHYPEGAFYKKHYDAFQGESNRKLSVILYLNPAWQHHDGGELVVYDKHDNIIEKVTPTFGKMVIFLSEEFPHEVLATHRSRYSLTGWFRINNTSGITLDPPA